jgi:hypothetical protein
MLYEQAGEILPPKNFYVYTFTRIGEDIKRSGEERDMGYVIAIGNCYCCRRLFGFNPHKVPSIRLSDDRREPICFDCVQQANPKRRASGLPEIEILEEAYGPEEE